MASELVTDLVGDIGGTNARFAISSGGVLSSTLDLRCADFPGPKAAIEHYFATVAPAVLPQRAALAVAGALIGDPVALTNNHWKFPTAAVRAHFCWQRLMLLNDFTALALSVPALQPDQLRAIGAGTAVQGTPIAVIGPGTGLGVSGLIPVGNLWTALATEGGHVTLPATTQREWQIISALRGNYPHVSAERVLSGSGIELLYQTLCKLDGLTPQPLNAAGITAAGLQEPRGPCRETLEMFCAWLGTVAGDLALSLGARGGVYIGGGIVPRLGEFFDRSGFHQRFTTKGRFSELLAAIPVRLIVAKNPALIGCQQAFDHHAPGLDARLNSET